MAILDLHIGGDNGGGGKLPLLEPLVSAGGWTRWINSGLMPFGKSIGKGRPANFPVEGLIALG